MTQGNGRTCGVAPDSMTPQFTGDELRKQLSRYDRQPFMDVLAAWLQCAPDVEDVMNFAKKKPDLYIKAVSDLARLAGYTDKREVTLNHNIKIEKMSDSQLEDRMRELANDLGIDVPGLLIEGEIIPEDAHNNEDAHNTTSDLDPS